MERGEERRDRLDEIRAVEVWKTVSWGVATRAEA